MSASKLSVVPNFSVSSNTLHIAIIGAGAAGLATARQALAADIDVTVFEQGDRVGGIWVFDAATDADPIGRNKNASVFSSLYESLRTNLPRDLMAFSDYTFDSDGGGDDNWQRFPHHSKVLAYLTAFANDFDLVPHIRFRTKVDRVVPNGPGWTVDVQSADSGQTQHQDFDAVVICNGHYSRPRVPTITGTDNFTGQWLHAHNYRNNKSFRGKTVALWGTAASGADISREIAGVAEQVYWCGDRFAESSGGTVDGMTVLDSPSHFETSGSLVTRDGARVNIDAFIYCTGYKYEFPFLDDTIVQVTDNRVYPLYLDIVSPEHPTLGFIGIPYLVVPFPLFDLQARWFMALLKDNVTLPSANDLQRYFDGRDRDTITRHYHKLGDNQATYMDLLARQCGAPPTPDWFHRLAKAAQDERLADPKGFRDKQFAVHGPTRIRDKDLPH